ncbi:unnamed protein product [Coffea canephora]|uniref:Uncharacterized protein n=1 Tax=Coffea canephora TaxID=49390 RepID=A0A068U1L4_COFCA|nr:unnamed protein product [Coffea canephora]
MKTDLTLIRGINLANSSLTDDTEIIQTNQLNYTNLFLDLYLYTGFLFFFFWVSSPSQPLSYWRTGQDSY